MYLKAVTVKNFGPLLDFQTQCVFDEEGNPQPILLTGINGAGKTSILANLIDAFVELKRKKYDALQEVEGNNYLKVGKKNFISSGKEYSYIHVDFLYEDKTASYIDFARKISAEEFDGKFDKNNFKNIHWGEQKLANHGYYKNVDASKDFLDTFENEILLYFPFSRYEVPAWWNPKEKIGFEITERYIEVSNRNFIKENVVKDVEEWLLNVFLDAELYEQQKIRMDQLSPETSPDDFVPEIGKALGQMNVLLGYSGKNTSFKQAINEILTVLYKTKDETIERVRLGVSRKNYRSIAVIAKHINSNHEITLAPTISHLSSGELMIFSLFCSILQEYDQLNRGENVSLSEIKGVVVIDEVDLHLHIDLQKNLLPKLIRKFPKIQFIITTHSPMFLMGMEDEFKDLRAINLPEGNPIPLSEFSEVQESFDLFIDKFSKFREAYQIAKDKVASVTRPLVITEGKTDWKHIKKAYERLREQNNIPEIKFDFLEYEDETNMGDTELLTLCEQFSKTEQLKKVICIFDRDNEKIISQHNEPFKDWGNNVYSFCIPKPSHRSEYNKISIEFLYTDEELKTLDENSKSLVFSNEVTQNIEKSMTTNETKLTLRFLDIPKADEEADKKIYDQDIKSIRNEEGQEVGISKSVFAQYVYDEKEGFASFDISAFRQILETIQQIIALE